MYTIVNRRKVNPETQEETLRRGQSEFFPKLKAAPGFVGFYLVADEENGINTAVIVWQDAASARAFQSQGEAWRRVLDEMGHKLESDNRGETVFSLEGQR